jgi:hypothetical protein
VNAAIGSRDLNAAKLLESKQNAVVRRNVMEDHTLSKCDLKIVFVSVSVRFGWTTAALNHSRHSERREEPKKGHNEVITARLLGMVSLLFIPPTGPSLRTVTERFFVCVVYGTNKKVGTVG